MSNLNPNAPAFPRNYSHDGHNGATHRTYLAAKALQGLCANSGGAFQANDHTGWGMVNCTVDDVAELAVALADATLRALAAPMEPRAVRQGEVKE
jgi:hypothetical protein